MTAIDGQLPDRQRDIVPELLEGGRKCGEWIAKEYRDTSEIAAKNGAGSKPRIGKGKKNSGR